MSAYRLAAFAAVASLLAAALKKERAEFALLVQIAAAAAIVLSILSACADVLRLLSSYSVRTGVQDGYFRLLLRALCMTAAGEWTSAFCRDAGLTALAVAVDAAVAVLTVRLCLPLLETVLNFAAGLLS